MAVSSISTDTTSEVGDINLAHTYKSIMWETSGQLIVEDGASLNITDTA